MENGLLIFIALGISVLLVFQLFLMKRKTVEKAEHVQDVLQKDLKSFSETQENTLLENIKIVSLKEFSFKENKPIEDNSIYGMLEGVLRTVPSLSTAIITGKSGLYKLHFAPQIIEGLSSGKYYLMPAQIGGEHLNVMQYGVKGIRGQGSVLQFNLPSTVATVAVIWQIMAVITQQKYLHDINKRLAEIEKGISTIINFLEDQDRGKQFGKITYLHGVIELLKDSSNNTKMDIFKNQVESIYRESLEGSSFKLISARRIVEEVKNKKFDASLKENSIKFKGDFQKYLEAIDSIIIYYYLISLCEYLSYSIEMEPNLGDARFLEIQRNHENLKKMISDDSTIFKNKSLEIGPRHWLETIMTGSLGITGHLIGKDINENRKKENKKLLSDWMEDLQTKCEESSQIISEVINSRTRVKDWLIETKSKGMDLVFETDTEGKIRRVASAPTVIK